MQTPSAQALLEVWERGQLATSAQRAMLVLAAAFPDSPRDDLAALPLGRRNALLLAVRVRLFGSELDGIAPCPRCGEALEIRFPLPDLDEIDHPTGYDALHELAVGTYSVHYRLPSTNDLLASPTSDVDEAEAERRLLASCLVEIRDDEVDVSPADLPSDVIERIGEAMAEADPYGLMELTTMCPGCEASCEVTFDPANYLWIEVDQWAWRMLRDVHELAFVYGWSEADVLAMSPWRRHAYLELIPA